MPAHSPQADTAAPSIMGAATWLIAGKILGFVATFALPLVLVRTLSQEEFGHYKQVFLLTATAISMLPCGFAMSAFYFLPRATNRGAVAFNVLLVYAAIGLVSATVVLLYPEILHGIFGDPEMVDLGPAVAAALLFGVAGAFIDLIALAQGDVKQAAGFIVLVNVVKTALLISVALAGGSVAMLVTAAAVTSAVQLTALIAYLRWRFGTFWRTPDFGLLRRQLAYAAPLGLAGWLYWLQMESHHYVVARQFDAATYAIYAVGCFSLPLTAVLGESVASVTIQRVSELHSQQRRDLVAAVVADAMRVLSAFYLPLYALLLITGRDLISLVFTDRYASAWPIFAVNVGIIPMMILAILSDAVIRCHLECRTFLVATRAVVVAVLVAALWWLTPQYGPIAAVSSMIAVNAAERLLIAGRAAVALGLTWRDLRIFSASGKCAAAAGAAAMAGLAVQAALPQGHALLRVAATGSAFGLTYLLAVRQLAILSPAETSRIVEIFSNARSMAVQAVSRPFLHASAPQAGAAPEEDRA